MKRTILPVALLLALVVPVAAAQPAATGHGSHHPQQGKASLDAEMAEHFKGITLTDAQVQKLVEIKAKHHHAMDAMKKDAKDPNDPKLKERLQKQMDAEHAEFKALLTPEQAKMFEENMKAHHKSEGKHEAHGKEGMKHDAKAATPPVRKPR